MRKPHDEVRYITYRKKFGQTWELDEDTILDDSMKEETFHLRKVSEIVKVNLQLSKQSLVHCHLSFRVLCK